MPRILIADDNSNIQKMVTLALHGAGIEVVSVSNGGAAIRTLPDTVPDLVLADVFMPVRSGYEVCDFIKHEPRFSHVPVVLLVGAFDPLDESEAQRVSADGILKKPFIPPDPLINLVKTLLAKSLNERPLTEPDRDHAPLNHAPTPVPANSDVAAPAAEFSEAPAEDFAPAAVAPDFGDPEETLAFGSLLEMSAPAEVSAEPLSPLVSPEPGDQRAGEGGQESDASLHDHTWGDSDEALAEEESSDSLRVAGERDFVGADIPELDQIASATHATEENSGGPAAAESEIEPAISEPASAGEFDFSSTPSSEFISDASPVAGAGASETPLEALPPVTEMAAMPWDRPAAEPQPVDSSLLGAPPSGGSSAEFATEESARGFEPEHEEQAAASPEVSAEISAEAPPSWTGPAVPVFPGSEKLWAAPPEAPSQGAEAMAPEAAEEIREAQHPAEPLPAAFEISAIEMPSFEPQTAEESPIVAAAAEPGMELAIPGAEPEPGAALSAADCDATAAAGLVEPPATDAAQVPPDPALIEAVVTRIVERMQPTVIDVVTREILRPLVEALVRREINKDN